MTQAIIQFKSKSIPVFKMNDAQSLDGLKVKLTELEYNFEFRKKLKRISSIDLIQDVAIFKYNDGTKLYLQVS